MSTSDRRCVVVLRSRASPRVWRRMKRLLLSSFLVAIACGKAVKDDGFRDPLVGGFGGEGAALTQAAAGGAAEMGSAAQAGLGAKGGESPISGGGGVASDGAGGGTTSGGTSTETCEALRQAAASALLPIVQASQSCREDSDCQPNSSLGDCYDGTFVLGGCWVSLSKASAEMVSARARDLCVPFSDAGCIGLHPCPAAPPSVCQSGTCSFFTK